jgi:hypothetical protein
MNVLSDLAFTFGDFAIVLIASCDVASVLFHGEVANISEANTPDGMGMHRATYRFTCVVCGRARQATSLRSLWAKTPHLFGGMLMATTPHFVVANSQGLGDIATNMATMPSICARLYKATCIHL